MKALVTAIILLFCLGMTLYCQEADHMFMAADQSLLVLPTAYTMPKNHHTLTNYEIFILQYAYGLTGSTHLSLAMPFPIVKEAFEYVAVGVKQNYLRHGRLQGAFSISWLPKAEGATLLNVLSYGTEKASGHFLVGTATDFEKFSDGAFLALGGIVSVSKRVSLISELITYSEVMDEEGGQLLTLGIRFKGDKISWDLGGFRPFTADTGGLILIPLIKMTVLF
jgi:hypothetical protein